MLYKYLPAERIDVLSAKRIRFTQPAALNDPFEMRPYFEALVNEAQMRSAIAEKPPDLTESLRKLYVQQPAAIKRRVSFEKFRQRANELLQTTDGRRIFEDSINKAFEVFKTFTPNFRAQFEDGFSKRIGILSLTELPDSVLMWAHYASQHTGFVVGFDEHHPYFNQKRSDSDEMFYLRKVAYRAPKTFAALTDMTGDDVMVSKSLDWAYEKEWRMFVPVASADEVIPHTAGDIYLFDFPPDCVRSLIFGARCDSAVRSTLATIASAPEFGRVEVMQANLESRSASIVVEAL